MPFYWAKQEANYFNHSTTWLTFEALPFVKHRTNYIRVQTRRNERADYNTDRPKTSWQYRRVKAGFPHSTGYYQNESPGMNRYGEYLARSLYLTSFCTISPSSNRRYYYWVFFYTVFFVDNS